MLVQIVISRLREEANREEFVNLTRAMVNWLEHQPGFISYELYEGERGWADRIVWSGPEVARAANSAFGKTPIGRRMAELVDPNYRGFMGSRLQL